MNRPADQTPTNQSPSPHGAPAIDATHTGDFDLPPQQMQANEDVLPNQIGPYKILQPIGQGGMGSVYMAEQSEPVKRRVALKIIKTDTPSKEILARFEAERQALALMDHHNIAKVLEAGVTEDGRPYFAMELVKGVPITEYCDKNKLDPKERLELFVQTCRAIQHAHMKGIIHRDIKPSNVLVTLYDGRPVAKVIDFGLAKALQDTNKLTEHTLFTQYGQVVGTLAYMSPEQAEMNALDVDTRTDVYSLGIILYELLTGSTPITREKIRNEAFDRILTLIREEEAPRPSQRLSDSGDQITGISEQRKIEPKRLSLLLKGDLDWIAVKALEKDRARRYETPSSLADDVQRYLNDEIIEARPPSFSYQLQKTLRKHKGKFVAGATGLGLLIAGLLGTGTMWYRASNAEHKARDSERTALAEAGKARAAEADAKVNAENAREAEEKERLALAEMEKERDKVEATLARSNYFLAVARWDANRAKDANTLLDKIPPQHRHFEWKLAKRQFRGSDWTCYGHSGAVRSVSFSPDGTRIATGSLDNTIKLWDADTGEELNTLKGHTHSVGCVSFSEDGTRIVSGSSDKTIKLWDASTGEELRTFEGHTKSFTCVSFSPDGTQIVSGGSDGTINLWDASSGEELRALKGHKDLVYCLRFSPDGIRIASGSWDNTVQLWDAATGEKLTTLKGHQRHVTSLSFSPDGTRIASGSRDNTLKLWDTATGEQLRTLKGHTDEVFSVSFSPDGMRIASGSFDNTIKVWDTSSGVELKTLKGHSSQVLSVSFSPNGTRIASGGWDNTLKLWDAATGEELRTLNGHTGNVYTVGFSPNGTRIATGSTDNTIKLWDVLTGEELRTLKGHTRYVYSVSFSPDGTRIATGSSDKSIKLWDAFTGEELKTLKGHTSVVNCVSFSPDGTRIATGSSDKSIKLWDASTGEQLRTLNAHTGNVNCVSFSPDGTRIVSGSYDNTLKLWDASTGEEIRTLNGHTKNVYSVSFSPDGTRIASGSWDKTIKLWSTATGEELRTLKGHTGNVNSVSFSPNGTRIASGSWDSTLKLWDAATGEELRSLNGHTQYVYSVSFSPDGTRIASGSWDKTIKLWDAPTGEQLKILDGHTEDVMSVSFNPDGTRLYSRSDTEQLVWELSTRQIIPNAKWNPRDEGKNRHGKWLAVPSGASILLVDTDFRETEREKAYRRFKAKPKPWWYREQMSAAQSASDTFAATFHACWLLVLDPNSRQAYDVLHKAHRGLPESVAKLLPPVVVESLVRPKPPIPRLSAPEALSINKRIWPIVISADSKPTQNDLEWMRAVVRDHPRGFHFNTLGVAQYRAGNYEAAIDACLQSLELTPGELELPGPSPIDLAILAMSHLQLGARVEANDYRQQLLHAIKLDAFRDDEECLGFVEEVNQLFDRPLVDKSGE